MLKRKHSAVHVLGVMSPQRAALHQSAMCRLHCDAREPCCPCMPELSWLEDCKVPLYVILLGTGYLAALCGWCMSLCKLQA